MRKMVLPSNPETINAAFALIRDGVIEVRADGTIWRLKNIIGPKLTAPRRLETKIKVGYLAVRFTFGGKSYMMSAHRLVWSVLRGTIPDGLVINHLDGNKTNNNPENLEVTTRSENCKHAYKVLNRQPPPHIRKPILRIIESKAKELRSRGFTFAQIADVLNVSQTAAFMAVKL